MYNENASNWKLILPVLIPIIIVNSTILLFNHKNIKLLVIITILSTIINLGIINWFGKDLLDKKLYTKEEIINNPVPPVSLATSFIFMIHFIRSFITKDKKIISYTMGSFLVGYIMYCIIPFLSTPVNVPNIFDLGIIENIDDDVKSI